MLKIDVEDRGNGNIVKVAGELGYNNFSVFENIFSRFYDLNLDVVALDLSEMPYIDSLGISRIHKVSRKLMSGGTDFVLVNLNEVNMKIFHMTTLDNVFKIMTREEFFREYFP